MAKILLIEDNAPLLAMERELLSEAGHDVVTATNGKEALLLFADTSFDLVVTDVGMPEKDGLETISHLRRKYPTLKIIAVSGGGRVEAGDYLVMARKLGAAQTLVKPFTGEQLIKAVDKVLRSSRA